MKKNDSRGWRMGRIAAGGGVVALGTVAGVLAGAVSPSLLGFREVAAGEQNFVRSFSHDAISGVRLDEEVTIQFSSAVYKPSVGPDTVLLRTGTNNGIQARGKYVVGRFMYDKRSQTRVVIRPEAIQEYYQLIKGLSRADASRQANNLVKRIEQTGNFKQLDRIDKKLRGFFGSGYGAGTRLDDPAVGAFYPAARGAGDPLLPYRTRIAGDDTLWQDYLVNRNEAAFLSLQSNSEYERFFHPVDPGTGVASPSSALRSREYRKVLIDRRAATRTMFVPEIPIRPDLADTGYLPGVAYAVIVPAWQEGVYNTVLTQDGHRPLLAAFGREFSTLFTTIPGTISSGNLFLDNESREGVSGLQSPRVINVTPPNGETYVDQTTDWEDPDNGEQVPVSARRTFTIRFRFAQPLDPRTVSPTNFTVTRVGSSSSQPDVPVSVGTFLNQNRLGIVEVEVTPATNLQAQSQYQLAVKGLVKSLGGQLLNTDYKVSFIVGPGSAPLDAIRETFSTNTNRANPSDPYTLDQITSALWPAPAAEDPQGTGRLVASFMPFAGFGSGAPADPSDANSPLVTSLVMTSGQSLTFPTEVLDPSQSNFGAQIEYQYQDVSLTAATIRSVGRFPLVIRSQSDIVLKQSAILVNGLAGNPGLTNADTVGGDPPGGLGGAGGSGGFRGGDGACSAKLREDGSPDLDGQGRLQFDQAKFGGSDGFPGYLATTTADGGAGSGGFTGNHEHPNYDFNNNGQDDDNTQIPERIREAGGGGGHATPGGNGQGSGLSGTGSPGLFNQALHPGGYAGGLGGTVYGAADMSDQPLNAFGVPVLTLGAGGAGGGGGGAEDDEDGDGALGTAGPEDSGGGGGGGGGGAFHGVARGRIEIDSSQIDASGGAGGRTFNAAQSAVGQGAPGGCGAGGSIWLQCYTDDVLVLNGSILNAKGGDNSVVPSEGQITTNQAGTGFLTGRGGNGGDGYVRIEDKDGNVSTVGSQVLGSLSTAAFRPGPDGSFPGRTLQPMVINESIAYSRWFNTQLDTPTFVPVFDDPLTVTVLEGTSYFDFDDIIGPNVGDSRVEIEVRTAPNDIDNNGAPALFQATNWFPLDQTSQINDRRFIQFRVTFTLPLSYSFSDPRPYVEYLQIDIQLQ